MLKIKILLKKLSTPKGFTFIELILYISIVTIMLTAIVPFGWNIIINSKKNTVEQEVFSQARYISERLKYEIRNANDINNVASDSVSLNTSLDPVTVIDLSNGKIRIKYGAQEAINLNSDDTNVSGLIFTDYTSSDSKTKHVEFNFTVTSNYISQRQEYKETTTIKSSAELRSN